MIGKTYKITEPTMALDLNHGRRAAITIPRGAVIQIVAELGGEGHHPMVDAKWQERVVRMFATDVRTRGVEL